MTAAYPQLRTTIIKNNIAVQSATNQFMVVLDIHVQNGHHEIEEAVHVLRERLLDVSAALGW